MRWKSPIRNLAREHSRLEYRQLDSRRSRAPSATRNPIRKPVYAALFSQSRAILPRLERLTTAIPLFDVFPSHATPFIMDPGGIGRCRTVLNLVKLPLERPKNPLVRRSFVCPRVLCLDKLKNRHGRDRNANRPCLSFERLPLLLFRLP